MRSIFIAAVVVLAACYNPDLSKVKFTCFPENPLCPDGLKCIDRCCGGPPCTTPQPPPTEDGGMPRDSGGAMDLTTSPDLWGTMGPAVGCRSGTGFTVSATVAGCPGTFTSDPSAQCANGWSACATNPLPAQACKNRNPFGITGQGCFIGAVRAADPQFPTSAATMRCNWANATSSDRRYLLGCGACVGFNDAAMSCGSSFPHTMMCDDMRPIVAFHCPTSVPGKDSDFMQLSNNDPNSGVLCCRN